MKKIVLFFLLIIISFSINAQFVRVRVFDNLLNTEVISSKHFNIIYKVKTKNTANDLIKIAESIYAVLKKQMRTEPIDKINILLTDQADVPNGFALQIPNNTINLYMTASSPDFIANERNWLEYVLLHEMTHIFNLTATYPSFIRYTHNSCFYIPNTVMPMYFLEGYTLYNESTILQGRMFNTNYEALLRSMILDKNKQPLDRAISYYNRDYPYATLAYLYGGYIFNEYYKKNNDITYFNRAYCLSCFPIGSFLPDISTRILGGMFPSYALIKVFEEAEERNRQLLSRFNISPREKITKDGNNNRLPTIHNNTVYFIGTFNNSSSYLCYYKKGKIKKLHRSVSTQKIAFAKINNQELILTDNLSTYKNIDLFYNIYSYNVKTKNFKKLPYTRRGMYPMVYKDKLIFIRNRFDKQYFIIYNLQSETPIDSFAFSNDYRYFNPTINRNGEILVSVYRNGSTDIAKISNIKFSKFLGIPTNTSQEKESIEFIVHSNGVDFYPIWSKNKNGFYFISDFEKINNIYFYSFDNDSVYSVYNTAYNTLSFDIDEKNHIIFMQDLSSTGFDIYYSKIKMNNNKNFVNVEYIKKQPQMTSIQARTKKYSVMQFSSPGLFLYLPLVFPSYDNNDSLVTFDILNNLIWSNSDIAHGIDYTTILLPFAIIHEYDSLNNMTTNYQYNFSQYFSINYFTPDIDLYYSLENNDQTLKSDTLTVGFAIAKSYFTLLSSNNIRTNIFYRKDSLNYIGSGLSHSFTYNLNYGPKNIAYSKGIYINTNAYYYTDINNINNSYYGGNILIANYWPLQNNSFFIKLSAYYDNCASITIENSALFIDTLNFNLIRPKIDIAGFSAPTTLFEDISDINIGITGPILFINRGIPLPFTISSQLFKLDYIYNTLETHLLYSYLNNYFDAAVTYSIGLNMVLGFQIRPYVYATHTASDNNITWGFGLSL